MGALLVYLLRRRSDVPRGYLILPVLGLGGAITMCFIRDGHGPGLLAGALLASVLKLPETADQRPKPENSTSEPTTAVGLT
jgi:hypothetical protein